MIITTMRTKKISAITQVDSASVELHIHDSVDQALQVLSRVREQWDEDDDVSVAHDDCSPREKHVVEIDVTTFGDWSSDHENFIDDVIRKFAKADTRTGDFARAFKYQRERLMFCSMYADAVAEVVNEDTFEKINVEFQARKKQAKQSESD